MKLKDQCQSCGGPGDVELIDGSVWCISCDLAARRMGYDQTPVARFNGVDVRSGPPGSRGDRLIAGSYLALWMAGVASWGAVWWPLAIAVAVVGFLGWRCLRATVLP